MLSRAQNDSGGKIARGFYRLREPSRLRFTLSKVEGGKPDLPHAGRVQTGYAAAPVETSGGQLGPYLGES